MCRETHIANFVKDGFREMEVELQKRIIARVVPALASGFLADRIGRLKLKRPMNERELKVILGECFAVLFQILTLLYADRRDLLTMEGKRFRKLVREIADFAGDSPSTTEENIGNHFSKDAYTIYPQIVAFYASIAGEQDGVIERLHARRVPDFYLAVAIDQLARRPDPKSNSKLTATRYESLAVRSLGTIYESLLEYRLSAAEKIHLRIDKAGRRAAGVYFTPENIVKYIVTHTVGPVLRRKLDALLPAFDLAEQMYLRESESGGMGVSPVLFLGRRMHGRDAHATARIYETHKDVIEELFDLKVLDPAMGSGHFLVEALHFITDKLLELLTLFPSFNLLRVILELKRKDLLKDFTAKGIKIDPHLLTEGNLLKREVLLRCLYGVDLNPLATELTTVSLWLEAGALGMPFGTFASQLRTGDSLTGEIVWSNLEVRSNKSDQAIARKFDDVTEESRFDCVIGNPPYLGHQGDFDGAPLRKRFRVCRDHANIAAAFVEHSFTSAKAGGMIGLIVPKSIQYVDRWEPTRDLVAIESRLEELTDVSEAFAGVLLEQSIIICTAGKPNSTYQGGVMRVDGAIEQRSLPIDSLSKFKCLPALIETKSLELLAQISKIAVPLGSISVTSQALGCQAQLNRNKTGRTLPILRGKHIRPLRLDPSADWIDESFLKSRRDGGFTAKVLAMRHPKIVSQNIIAHITRPKPRLWIISAPDDNGLICLNTVSTTLIHDPRYDHRFVSVILNSSLAGWFYREFVFCRAVRTMHFDQYYAGKLPVIVLAPLLRGDLAMLLNDAAHEPSRGKRQRIIDEFVFTAYALEPRQKAFIIDYCYGVEGYASLDGLTRSSNDSSECGCRRPTA